MFSPTLLFSLTLYWVRVYIYTTSWCEWTNRTFFLFNFVIKWILLNPNHCPCLPLISSPNTSCSPLPCGFPKRLPPGQATSSLSFTHFRQNKEKEKTSPSTSPIQIPSGLNNAPLVLPLVHYSPAELVMQTNLLLFTVHSTSTSIHQIVVQSSSLRPCYHSL